jgi:alkylhydroperoxidase/carboxymuconolactone decarboxylase family protein YurZ
VTTPQKREILEKIQRESGMVLGFHKMMVEADPDWLQAMHAFVQASYTRQRTLDRKTLELIQICVNTATRAAPAATRFHIKLALEEGATPTEILEAAQSVIMLTGSNAFHEFREAWAAEVGVEIPEF